MKIQSFSDIITNSSSELFVFNDGKTVEEVEKILDEIYPAWRTEYNSPVKLKDCNESEVGCYQEYSDSGYYVYFEKKRYCEKHGIEPTYVDSYEGVAYYDDNIPESEFDKNDCYAKEHAESYGLTPEEMYENWDNYNPFSNEWKKEWLDHTEKFLRLFEDLHKDEVLLFSIDENPNWDYQEKLMNVAKRIHLG